MKLDNCLAVLLAMSGIAVVRSGPFVAVEHSLFSRNSAANARATTTGVGAIVATGFASILSKLEKIEGKGQGDSGGGGNSGSNGNGDSSGGTNGNDEPPPKFDPTNGGKGKKRPGPLGDLYQDANDKKVWWSKTLGNGHGGKVWEKYRRRGGWLIHEANVDGTGREIPTKKGKKGSKIRF